jgi:predicted dehydrogenase
MKAALENWFHPEPQYMLQFLFLSLPWLLQFRSRLPLWAAGLIGPRHARSVIANPSAELVALVDPAPTGPAIAAELGTAHFASVSDLLASPTDKPNAAIICTPNHTHVPIARQLLSGGVHVLAEKPVSTDIESGLSLLEHERTQAPDVKFLVGHRRRFNPYVVKAKKILDSGSLGQIMAVNGLWALYKPEEYFDAPMEWHRDKTAGVVMINLLHDLDLL